MQPGHLLVGPRRLTSSRQWDRGEDSVNLDIADAPARKLMSKQQKPQASCNRQWAAEWILPKKKKKKKKDRKKVRTPDAWDAQT